MNDWYLGTWIAYGWVMANLVPSLIIDWKPRGDHVFTAGAHWTQCVWLPAYLKWRRARLAESDERWNVQPVTPGGETTVSRDTVALETPRCARCGLSHGPADWLNETCPYASPDVIADRVRVLGSHCPHCGAVHSLAEPYEVQLCEDEQHGVVRGTE